MLSQIPCYKSVVLKLEPASVSPGGLPPPLTHTHTYTHTCACTHIHTHTLTHTHTTHPLTHSLSHTHSHTLSHTLTHTHASRNNSTNSFLFSLRKVQIFRVGSIFVTTNDNLSNLNIFVDMSKKKKVGLVRPKW